MGCDIHLWIEGKDKKGNWFVANPRYVDYGDPSQIREVEEYDVGRSYLLFSALANVRNEQDIPFIQSNRGLPSDIQRMLNLMLKSGEEQPILMVMCLLQNWEYIVMSTKILTILLSRRRQNRFFTCTINYGFYPGESLIVKLGIL